MKTLFQSSKAVLKGFICFFLLILLQQGFAQKDVKGLPEDAAIDSASMVYWIGTGPNHAILAVNWCDTSLAFAWGYRFNTDSILVSQMMDDIQQNDSRFSFTYTDGAYGRYITDITYQDNVYDLELEGSYWMYNLNGKGAGFSTNQQYIYSGDFVKFGDESCGQSDTLYNYSWTSPVQPVSIPTNIREMNPESSVSIVLYPNPTNDIVYIKKSQSSLNTNTEVVLYDLSGRIVKKEVVSDKINVSDLKNGIYFVDMEGFVCKLIKR